MPAQWVETKEIPLAELTQWPGNSRRGNVAEIRKSIRTNGQYRAIVVRVLEDRLLILAGNHTYDAVRLEGHATIRCELIICTDQEARKINLADNRLSDLALDDPDALVELLSYLDGDYDGTGWTDLDIERMITPPEPDPNAGDPPGGSEREPTEHTCPNCGHQFTDS